MTGSTTGSRARTAERRGLLLAFAAFWGAWVGALPDLRAQSAATTRPTALARTAALAGVIAVAGPLVLRASAPRPAGATPAPTRVLANRP